MSSMIITLTVPDAKAVEVLQIVTDQLGYEGEGTRKAFLDLKIKEFVKNAYVDGKLREQRMADQAEEEALREANRAEQDTVREAAEAVNIDVAS